MDGTKNSPTKLFLKIKLFLTNKNNACILMKKIKVSNI